MKIIKTAKFLLSYGPSVDDQPGFINRDVSGQGPVLFEDNVPASKDQIIKNWKKKQKKITKKDEIPRGTT